MNRLVQQLRSLYTCSLFLLIYLLNNVAYSQVTITSFSTIASTCPNNGSITINAQSSNLPLLYSIITGPVTQPAQTNNTFNSLPAGNYTVQVYDGSGNSSTKAIVITGNYQELDFNPATTNPTCNGSSDGRIVGNRTYYTGLGPFTWQLIAPSPVTSAPQSSDDFTNLPAGNYTVRVTDACGGYRTVVASLNDPGNFNLRFNNPPTVEIIGCDSAMVNLFLGTDAFRFPMTYKFETADGTYITTTPYSIDQTNGSGYFMVQNIVPKLSYGEYVNITVTDACGNNIIYPTAYARTFNVCPSYSYKFIDCQYKSQINFNINNPGCMRQNELYTYFKAPLSYQFIDIATNAIADSGTIKGDPSHIWYNGISGMTMKPVTSNRNYKLTIKDGCGNIFTNNYFVVNPTMNPPVIASKDIQKYSCLDSTAMASVFTMDFKTIPRLILLSGPIKLGSSKPDYAYSGSYTYPDTLLPTGYGAAAYSFDMLNLSVGTYRFKIIDSCGSELSDSIVIKPQNVTNLNHKFSYKKGCLGKNEIHYSLPWVTFGSMSVSSIINGGTVGYKYYDRFGPVKDSILNVPSGTYIVEFKYEAYPGLSISPSIPCTKIIDTIVIEGYRTPEILVANSITCGGNILVELLADSTKGVPPYQYEIISGPETFPVQNSNTFIVASPGVYTARVYDICGNASTKQIAVDNIKTATTPLISQNTCNSIKLIYPSSNYFKHKWTKPGGTIVWSDSLIINNITEADTGTYHLSLVVSINGCTDTHDTLFHVSLNGSKQIKSISICSGDSVTIGTNKYFTNGLYTNTLSSSAGCDSIIELHLTVWPKPIVNLGKDTSICKGQQLTLYAGTAGNTYFWNNSPTGTSMNTFSVNNVGKYWVKVISQYGCNASDTIEVLSLKPIPIPNAGKDTTICKGQSVQLNASGSDDIEWLFEGKKQPSIIVAPASTTSYIIKATNDCGSATDEVRVIIVENPKGPLFSNNTIEHCFEKQPLLITANTGNTFIWPSSGETTQSIAVSQPGTYEVTVFNEYGCSLSDKITITEICNSGIFLPDAFSPNNDGLNDRLEVFGKNFTNFEIKIFNRWGEIIFISSDPKKQWDGNYLGEEMPIGTYPYVLSYKNISDINSEIQVIRGCITLIR